MHIDTLGTHRIRLGFDDWMKVWVDGQEVYRGRHDSGFEVETVECDLPAGDVEFRVKLSNKDNEQWRLWALNFILEKA